MRQDPRICPAMMCADFGDLRGVCEHLDSSGAALLHLDIMDGSVTPQITFGPQAAHTICALAKTPAEIHLSVRDPLKVAQQCAGIAAERIIVQVEAARVLDHANVDGSSRRTALGAAIYASSPVELMKSWLPWIDKIVIVSTHNGVTASVAQLGERIAALRALCLAVPEHDNICVQVDGGVDSLRIRPLWEFGADEFVCGSAIFNPSGSPAQNIRRLQESCNC